MQKATYEFISQQTNDPIVERHTCRRCGSDFPIFEGDKKMLEKLAPTIGGERFELPLPTCCPECRERRRLSFRKERILYKRTCDSCKKNMVSIFPQEDEHLVYCPSCRYSDKYTPTEYGQDIERSKPLLEQMQILHKRAPIIGLFNGNDNENSEFTQHSGTDKNSYLCGAILNSEDAYYSIGISYCDTIIDLSMGTNVSIAYEGTNITQSNRIFFSSFIQGSSYVWLSDNVENSNYVLLSSGVRNQNYVYMNQQLSKEDRNSKLEEVQKQMKSHAGLQKLFSQHKNIKKQTIHRAINLINTENSTGNEITNSQNVLCGFDSDHIKDGRYLSYCRGSENVMDVYAAYAKTEKVYDCESCGGDTYHSYFSDTPRASSYIYYTNLAIYGCLHILASCAIKSNTSYTILNKKYSEKERNTIAPKLIKKMQDEGLRGEFLDTSLSYSAYNDSIANDYHPVHKVSINGKEEVIDPKGKGTVIIQEPEKFLSKAVLDLGGKESFPILWRTRNQEINISQNQPTIQARDLPDNLDDVQNDILDKVIICEATGRPFKLVKQELEFYRKYGIPLPRRHHDVRHKDRLDLKPPRTLHLRTCDKCKTETLSVYPQDSDLKVYCEHCYNKEIYG